MAFKCSLGCNDLINDERDFVLHIASHLTQRNTRNCIEKCCNDSISQNYLIVRHYKRKHLELVREIISISDETFRSRL